MFVGPAAKCALANIINLFALLLLVLLKDTNSLPYCLVLQCQLEHLTN